MLWTERGGITEDPYVWFAENEVRKVVQKRLKMTDRMFGMSHGKALGSIGEWYRPSIQKMIWGESPTMEKLRRDGKVERWKVDSAHCVTDWMGRDTF